MTEKIDPVKDAIAERDSLLAKEKDAANCTCDDEWAVHPCPDHFHKPDVPAQDADPVSLKDEDLWEKKPGHFFGFKFVCPKCKQDAIIHYFNHCPNCGLKVAMRSTHVRDAIRAMNSKK